MEQPLAAEVKKTEHDDRSREAGEVELKLDEVSSPGPEDLKVSNQSEEVGKQEEMEIAKDLHERLVDAEKNQVAAEEKADIPHAQEKHEEKAEINEVQQAETDQEQIQMEEDPDVTQPLDLSKEGVEETCAQPDQSTTSEAGVEDSKDVQAISVSEHEVPEIVQQSEPAKQDTSSTEEAVDSVTDQSHEPITEQSFNSPAEQEGEVTKDHTSEKEEATPAVQMPEQVSQPCEAAPEKSSDASEQQQGEATVEQMSEKEEASPAVEVTEQSKPIEAVAESSEQQGEATVEPATAVNQEPVKEEAQTSEPVAASPVTNQEAIKEEVQTPEPVVESPVTNQEELEQDTQQSVTDEKMDPEPEIQATAESQQEPEIQETSPSQDTEKKETQEVADDELDSLTNMIEHMALTQTSAKEETDTVSHETPEEQQAKKDALPGIQVLSAVQPPEEAPSAGQPGDSHPEPYRLTKDSCSSDQEMMEAMTAAAAAEQDLSRPVSSPSRADPPGDMLHHIKQIEFKDKKVGVVTQNENGPCPLVAIINVLLLRWEINLPSTEIVSAAKLMEYIGHSMLESVPKNLSGEERMNYEQNMHDAMAVLPKLQTGLDVNVKFTGVRDFEYTPECIIFDLLRIPLYHGWLVDPQAQEVARAVGQAGYNQLVEKVISQKGSSNEDRVTEALIIESFLERTASQLTYHGLTELNAAMNEGEIGVLFRNNHFSTVYKHQKELLQLVTDQGFLGESNVVWETLSSIDGDGQFVDSQFRTVPPKPEPTPPSSSPNTSQLTAEQQIDHDFLVALSLQDEQQPAAQQEEASGEEKTTQEKADEELARQLQQEEEREAAEAARASPPPQQQQQQQQQPQDAQSARSPQQKKKENCNIL